ncbi:MAG: hypothetical protein KAI47_28415 [Deltaproteobacteria bacterium]|nr:hypothetical protein [Deltaproteobacteria bacterium]
MRDAWQREQGKQVEMAAEGIAPAWTLREVILDFNGPQLTVMDGPDGTYLSMASDEDQAVVRWLRALVSDVELEALLSGGTTVRECLLKPHLWVVDEKPDGTLRDQWRVALDDLDKEELPEPDSYLPSEFVEAHRAPVRQPEIVLDGSFSKNHTISIKLLGEYLVKLQSLWNAIGQKIYGTVTTSGAFKTHLLERTAMAMTGFGEGSVVISIAPSEPEVFTTVATRYKELVTAGADPHRLQASLRELQTRVRSSYAEYLALLQRNKLSVLGRWGDERVFLHHGTAARIKPTLEQLDEAHEEVFTARGYFVGFNLRKASFELRDPDNEETYEGSVSRKFLRQADPQITLGPSTLYGVEIASVVFMAVEGEPTTRMTLEKVFPAG